MASAFSVVVEDFIDDLEAIRTLVDTFSDPSKTAKSRLAAANSATLLVAATFEEFVREMAREYARAVVLSADSFEKLPNKLASTAWKRTMDGLSKVRLDGAEGQFGAAQARFAVIYEFCKGDLSQDIYRALIHNENNMRPGEINGLFKVSGLGDVCTKLCDKACILEVLGETEAAKTHGKMLSTIEDFIDRRNSIAHALNPGQSSAPEQIARDITFLECFAKALCETLEQLAPAAAAAG